jgi:hypothetical protein
MRTLIMIVRICNGVDFCQLVKEVFFSVDTRVLTLVTWLIRVCTEVNSTIAFYYIALHLFLTNLCDYRGHQLWTIRVIIDMGSKALFHNVLSQF